MKKAVTPVGTSSAAAPVKAKKASAAVPVPLFQAPTKAKSAPKKISAASSVESSEVSEKVDGSTERTRGGRTRGSRGGRGRGRGRNEENQVESESTSTDADEENSEGGVHRRRRRRVVGADVEVTAGQSVDEDGVVTTIRVREPRERKVPVTRVDAKRDRDSRDTRDGRGRNNRSSRDRNDRSERTDRRRTPVITEAEFLARRESVDRVMLVRQSGDRTQIAVLEDNILVEHYVNRNTNASYVGNVYLGRVQNVLPSMEAAFVDIGKGRNAVLYAGEVNWDAAGLADGTPRKIETALKSGQPVLVQVTKDPIGQKGARLTSQVSLPGRYLVYVPGGGMSGISRRLPDQERTRLKAILKNLVPEEAGVIVRTAAEGATEEELTRDVTRLQAQWEDIEKKTNDSNATAPSLLYGEPDLNIRVVRDIFNEDFNKLIVEGSDAWDEINNYLGFVAPDLLTRLEKWHKNTDIFAEHRIDEQLAKGLDRKVYLPSGGSLVIDRTEAMVVVDVNTGKFIGKGGNLEETVTKNNLEAAEEIARQLRLRDLGGIIVVDFIDMILESNRDLVLRRLTECLGRDRTKHQVAEVTSLGLVQMTRKRVGQGLIEAFSTTCESCNGRGIHIHVDPVPVSPENLRRDEVAATPGARDEEEEERAETEEDAGDEDVLMVAAAEQSEPETASEPQTEAAPISPTRRGRRRVTSGGIITPGAAEAE
ncbi:MAG: Rne/Rng family ribonuclease [Actinobacteria bacterium]|nr:Rne/Rng family ribonuclease [Actinomycetota bacterium]